MIYKNQFFQQFFSVPLFSHSIPPLFLLKLATSPRRMRSYKQILYWHNILTFRWRKCNSKHDVSVSGHKCECEHPVGPNVMVSADRETRDQAPGCQLQILKLNSAHQAPGISPCPRLHHITSACLILSFLSIFMLFSTFSCQYFGLDWNRSKTNQPGSRIATEHHNMEISLSWFSGASTGRHHTGNCSTASAAACSEVNVLCRE